MILIILKIAHAMICETWLPDGAALPHAIRKSSFDELHSPLQGNLLGGRQQQMDVIGHDDKLVQKKFLLVAIMRQRFNQKIGVRLAPEDRTTLSSNRRDEEDAIAFHLAIVIGMGVCCL